jgi:hypothetical protein
MSSRFLVPQVYIQNLERELRSHPAFLREAAHFDTLDSTLDPAQLDSLRAAIANSGQVFNAPDVEYEGYTWTQEGDLLTITYDSPIDIAVDSIVIANDSISSPLISGAFFGHVLNHDVSVRSGKVRIQLQTENVIWPIVIVGGDLDCTSCFLLALAAEKLELPEIRVSLLLRGAEIADSPFCMRELATIYRERGLQEAAFYWNVRVVETDPTALVNTCGFLLGPQKWGRNFCIWRLEPCAGLVTPSELAEVGSANSPF